MENKELRIKELWDEYYNVCKDCGPGNGCDDCRDCPEAEKKYEIYKKIKELES